jgi:hypothetical protein
MSRRDVYGENWAGNMKDRLRGSSPRQLGLSIPLQSPHGLFLLLSGFSRDAKPGDGLTSSRRVVLDRPGLMRRIIFHELGCIYISELQILPLTQQNASVALLFIHILGNTTVESTA